MCAGGCLTSYLRVDMCAGGLCTYMQVALQTDKDETTGTSVCTGG